MNRYFKILAVPISATVVNALLTPLYGLLPSPGGDIVFNGIRIALWVFAGWRLGFVGQFGMWKSALSGAILLFIDHPIIKGGYFLFRQEFMAFGGVMVSYCMFWLVPVGISAIGAGVGKRSTKEGRTNRSAIPRRARRRSSRVR